MKIKVTLVMAMAVILAGCMGENEFLTEVNTQIDDCQDRTGEPCSWVVIPDKDVGVIHGIYSSYDVEIKNVGKSTKSTTSISNQSVDGKSIVLGAAVAGATVLGLLD
jgi:hypothetical protein